MEISDRRLGKSVQKPRGRRYSSDAIRLRKQTGGHGNEEKVYGKLHVGKWEKPPHREDEWNQNPMQRTEQEKMQK